MKGKTDYLPAFGAALLGTLIILLCVWSFRGLAKSRAEAELTATLHALLPGNTAFRTEEGDGAMVQKLYRGSTGTVAEVRCPGYVAEVTMLVAVDQTGKVCGLVVRSAQETPGLGGNILCDRAFMAQFLRSGGNAQLGTEIKAITGATVSSRAVCRCVNAAVGAVTGADIPSQATPWEGTP